ncbi:hypothetical protein CJ97_gp11 [Ralstonia phage RSB2]|uniref:Uncharacterized protein ORF11 n=1 Tax=Ralstonia phage RSB2 TaxID=913183 RepID=E5RUZ1_9CAUD|nr:hypothetical protein CJ97_gp11 [Ralstonia phage RSB2]BAJ51799.1 hypothetical protein [Ralstonia phage RSB2]
MRLRRLGQPAMMPPLTDPSWATVKAATFAVAGVPAKWNLGVGPCGEYVETLRVFMSATDLVIHQITNQSEKLFVYARSDITGRVTFQL